jgi:hypothetical protein
MLTITSLSDDGRRRLLQPTTDTDLDRLRIEGDELECPLQPVTDADLARLRIVGPAADKQKAARFAKDCLDAFHSTNGIEIDCSPIPYRHPW